MSTAKSVFFDRVPTSLGTMVLASDGDALTGAWFDGQRHQPPIERVLAASGATCAILRRAAIGARRVFRGRAHGVLAAARAGGHAVPARGLAGDRRRAVRRDDRLSRPRGAHRAPGSIRAAGAATGRNPLSIVIPCHRIVGADGALTGYAGGIERKRTLLALEQRGACRARRADARPEGQRVRRSDAARLLALSAIWGSSFIFIRVIAPVLGPVLTVVTRVLIGGAVLVAYCRIIGVRRRGRAALAPVRGDRRRQLDVAVHAVRVRRAAHPRVVLGHPQFDGAAVHRAPRGAAARRAADGRRRSPASSSAPPASRS